MARAPNEKLGKAYELFKKGYKLIEISRELDIPDGTVRRWKKTYNWGNERSNDKSINNERSIKTVKNNKSKNKAITKEIGEVLNNTELTDKQKLFCVIYSRCLNATKAYQKAYMCTYETAMVEGNKNLRKPKIKAQIDSLIAKDFNKEFIKRSVIQKYIDIAFSDIGDYIKFGKKTNKVWGVDSNGNPVPVIDPETGEQKEHEYNYIDLKESSMVDTTLISEVSEGKDGVKFKLIDKMKAMDFITKHCNLLSDEEKIQLDLEYKKLQNEKIEVEIDKLKQSIESDDKEEVEDDGFIAALGNKANEVWADEETS